jgi:two-component system cell cycle sensor histidine kinase/response regulator CckA
MKNLPYGVWRYGVLLILLLVLAAVASLSTLTYLETHPDLQVAPEAVRMVSLKLMGLIMGFLFISGAMGLLAIRTTIDSESRRRIGRMVDAMNSLSDGILAVDPRGNITGSNTSARAMSAGMPEGSIHLLDAYPCLNPEDAALLLDAARPREVERVSRSGTRSCTLRFRSEPLEGLWVMLISDVSEERSQDAQQRRVAQLQLIGRIARGVAHDFNNILCAIGGHASLLARQRRHGADMPSVHAIVREADRGAALARQLMDLSRSGVQGKPCDQLVEYAGRAVDMVRVSLPEGWRVESRLDGSFPPVPFSGIQMEQMILNLSLLAADELEQPGELRIELRAPEREHQRELAEPAAVLVAITAGDPGCVETGEALVSMDVPASAESGVIFSVLRTMAEEVGGRLLLYVSSRRHPMYCLLLPRAELAAPAAGAPEGMPEELRCYLAHWMVLLACAPRKERDELERRLKLLGAAVSVADNLVGALAEVDGGRHYNAMVFDRALLGDDSTGLLRAVLKLQRGAGIVLLGDGPGGSAAPGGFEEDVAVESTRATADQVLEAMLRARERAGLRRQAA